MIKLKEVTKESFEEVIALKVDEKQEGFLRSNIYSLAQAKFYPEMCPLAIYDDDEVLVGFLMYRTDHLKGNSYLIFRLMIDEQYQAKGYVREALTILIKKLQKDKSRDTIYIDVKPENSVAIKLYKELGFIDKGKIVEGEIVLELSY